MNVKLLIIAGLLFIGLSSSCQNADIELYRNALFNSEDIVSDLSELCDEIGGRVTGSAANHEAVSWGIQKFEEAGVRVDKFEFEMPVLWMEESLSCTVSDQDEIAFSPQAVSKYMTQGGLHKGMLVNVGIGDSLSFAKVKDKIADNFVIVETDLCIDIDGLFAEYVHAANVEMLANQYKAKGIVFMASRPRGLLYRFISSKTHMATLPQFVMVREDAKRCMRLLDQGTELTLEAQVSVQQGDAFACHNVIGEILGSDKLEEVIIIGAHLDSWALGTGANDNGCNVAMMIDLARKMKALNIRPKRTIRFALWNGEEQGYFGSQAYTEHYKADLDNHKLAVSIDIGSGEVTGFFTNGREDLITLIDSLTAHQSLTQLNIPIVGTDNFDFMMHGVPNLVGIHKPQLYGYNYHASSDTFDKVDTTMLKQNSANIGELILKFANLDTIDLPQQSRSQIQEIIDDHELEFTLKMFNVWDGWVDLTRGRVD